MIELRCRMCGLLFVVTKDELRLGPSIYRYCRDCRSSKDRPLADCPGCRPPEGALERPPRSRPVGSGGMTYLIAAILAAEVGQAVVLVARLVRSRLLPFWSGFGPRLVRRWTVGMIPGSNLDKPDTRKRAIG